LIRSTKSNLDTTIKNSSIHIIQQSKSKQEENEYAEYTYEPSYIIERSHITNLIQEDSGDITDSEQQAIS
jgi:hypothetical protein